MLFRSYVSYIESSNPSYKGLAVRGAASQTANLQEWQNSSGTALIKVDAGGMLIVGNTTGTIQVKSSGSTGSYPTSGAGIELIAGAFSGSDSIQAYNRDTSTWRYLAFYSAGNQFLSTYASSIPVIITGAASQSANLTEWRNSSASVLASMSASGAFSAVTKSFVIKHPIEEGKLLRYGSLEGPENGVYIRGKIDGGNVIDLPDYWTALVDESTITVNITPIGSSQNLYIEEIKNNKVYVAGGMDAKFFYTVFAERKDVAKLVVEE